MLAAHKGELPQVTLNRAQADVYDQAFASAPRGCLVPMRRHTRTTQLGLPCHTLTAQQRPAVAFMDPPEEPEEHTGPGEDAGTDAADGTDGEGTLPVATVDDLRFRMLSIEEMRRIMAYGDDFQFAGPDGREPSQLEKIRLLGNGVTPPVLDWLNRQMLAVL
jgi:site-specific DNA-cytosine methylase